MPLRHRLPAPSLSRLLSFPRAFSKTSRGISCSSLRPRMGPRPVSPWRSTRRWAGGWDCQETVRRGPGGGSSEGTCLLSWPPLPRPVRMAVEPSCCQWPAEKCPRESTSVSGLGSPPPQVPAGGSGCSCPPPPTPQAQLLQPRPVLAPPVHHYGRAVIMFGVPYVYTQSRILKVSSAGVGVARSGLWGPSLGTGVGRSGRRDRSALFSRAGTAGIPAGPVPDPRERLSHLRRHAPRGPVCGAGHPGQDGLRPHGLR